MVLIRGQLSAAGVGPGGAAGMYGGFKVATRTPVLQALPVRGGQRWRDCCTPR